MNKLILSLVALLATTMSNSQVTNVVALTIGSTGTNVTSTVANSSTTPVITLNIPNAGSTVTRGLITNTTQTITGAKTFNSPITATGFKVNGYVSEYWSGSGFLKADGTIDYYNYVQQPSGNILYAPEPGKASYIPKYYDIPHEWTGEVEPFTTMIMDSQIFDNGANVGIGTNTPTAKFHVEGDINATGLARKIGFSVNDIDPLTSRARYGLTQLSNYSITGETNFTRPGVALSGYFGLSFFTGDSEAMRISDWGNVGIGTNDPKAKFDVEGGDFYLGENVSANGTRRELRVYGFDSGSKFYGSAHANYDNDKRTFDISTNNQTEQLKIDASSNANGFISLWPGASAGVGIGTLTTGSHKLAVEGTIGAREVKVYLGAWSDFVFKKEYKLPTLQEVETHIKDKGYLKDIPSEKEVLQNGVNLGEMNSKLLQKVEELTLYLIQQNKDIELLKAQVKVLTTK